MAKRRQCRGCGAYLQSKDESKTGYLPEHLLADDGRALVCQRCYRITHYGKEQHTTITGQDAVEMVKAGVGWGDAVLLILDLIDFEPSLSVALDTVLGDKPVVAVVNKGDLLPPKTRVAEVQAWVERQLAHRHVRFPVFVVSATTGAGVAGLLDYINAYDYRRWTVVGATNVGKSTIIGRLLQMGKKQGGGNPTVARFPGTTVECLQWKLTNKITLADTPGLVPGGRLSDQVCHSCAPKLIPGKRLSVKVYELSANSALVNPGFAAVQVINESEDNHQAVLLGFSASDVSWRRANINKIGYWLDKSCGDCQFDQWEQHQVAIPAEHDLVIYGLGWVSVRKTAVRCQLTIPAKVEFSLRENLVGPK